MAKSKTKKYKKHRNNSTEHYQLPSIFEDFAKNREHFAKLQEMLLQQGVDNISQTHYHHHSMPVWDQGTQKAVAFGRISGNDANYLMEYDIHSTRWLSLLQKVFGQHSQQYKKIIEMGYRHLIDINFPRTKTEFESGNGERCWVWVNDDVYQKYNANFNGGNFEAYLDNYCTTYPEIQLHDKIKFTMRGEKCPVVLMDECLSQYRAISDEQYKILMSMTVTGLLDEEIIANKMLELLNTDD